MSFKKLTVPKVLPWILLIGSIIGYVCAFVIMWDKVKLADNPNYIPSCSLNPVISCGTVMKSWQANAFGFPNPFIGLGAFPAVAVVGGAILAGARFKRWFWLTLAAGYTLGLAFAYWLLIESVYNIKALCPFCLTIDLVMTITWWYLALYVFDEKLLKLPKGKTQAAFAWVRRHHLDLLVLWLLIVIFFILKHFWYYYGKHLF